MVMHNRQGPPAAARGHLQCWPIISHACHYWRLMASSFSGGQWDVTMNST